MLDAHNQGLELELELDQGWHVSQNIDQNILAIEEIIGIESDGSPTTYARV